MVSKQTLGILAVVGLLFITGCSAIPGIGGSSTPDTPENNTTEAGIDYPYGWNESGLQSSAIQQGNPMLTESSLTFEFTREIQLATGSDSGLETVSRTEQTHRVNGVQNVWYITVERQQSISEYYFESGTGFVQTSVVNSDGEVEGQSHSSASREFQRVDAYQVKGAEQMILATNWSEPTVTTHRNQEVVEYTANGPDAAYRENPVYNLGETSNLTDYEATLYVSKDSGNILDLTASVEGTRADDEFAANFEFSYSNFSDTTVQEPDWVSDVQNNSTTTMNVSNITGQLNNPSPQVHSD